MRPRRQCSERSESFASSSSRRESVPVTRRWARGAGRGFLQAGAEVGGLDRGHRRLESLVPALGARPFESLLERVARQDAERDGKVELERDLENALRRLPRHVLEVRRAATQYGAEGHERVEPAGPREIAEGERELPRPGNADENDVLVSGTRPSERVESSFDEARHDEVVRACRDDAEAPARGGKMPFYGVHGTRECISLSAARGRGRAREVLRSRSSRRNER